MGFAAGLQAGMALRNNRKNQELKEKEFELKEKEFEWKQQDREIQQKQQQKQDFATSQKLVESYNSNKENLSKEYSNAFKKLKLEFINSSGDMDTKAASTLEFNETVKKLNEKHQAIKGNTATFLQN